MPRRRLLCVTIRAFVAHAHYAYHTRPTRSFGPGQPWGCMGVDSEWPPWHIYACIHTIFCVPWRHVLCLISSAFIAHAQYAYYTSPTPSFWHGQPCGWHGSGLRVAPGHKEATHTYMHVCMHSHQGVCATEALGMRGNPCIYRTCTYA